MADLPVVVQRILDACLTPLEYAQRAQLQDIFQNWTQVPKPVFQPCAALYLIAKLSVIHPALWTPVQDILRGWNDGRGSRQRADLQPIDDLIDAMHRINHVQNSETQLLAAVGVAVSDLAALRKGTHAQEEVQKAVLKRGITIFQEKTRQDIQRLLSGTEGLGADTMEVDDGTYMPAEGSEQDAHSRRCKGGKQALPTSNSPDNAVKRSKQK